MKKLPACFCGSVNAEDSPIWPAALICGGCVFLEQYFEYFIVVHFSMHVLCVGMQHTPWQNVRMWLVTSTTLKAFSARFSLAFLIFVFCTGFSQGKTENCKHFVPILTFFHFHYCSTLFAFPLDVCHFAAFFSLLRTYRIGA